MSKQVKSKQVKHLRWYRADMVFPPWAGQLPWAWPRFPGRAACAGERR